MAMAMESTMVIKVKYGDTLRRFNVHVDENETLDLDIDGLKAKILGLFNFPPDADLTLTYIDEDGDIVTLVDDDDLRDVMKQRLKFLRIDVQLKNDKFGKAYARSSGCSTPLRSPRVQHPLPEINNKVAEVLKSVPEPLYEALSKLSLEFASKASSSLMLADLVECFSKLGLSHLNLVSQSQPDAESSRRAEASEREMPPSVPKDPNTPKDGGLKEVLPKATAVDTSSKSSQEVDVGNAIRGVQAPFMPFASPVDLNSVPLIDSIPSGSSTVCLAPAASNVLAVGDRNEAKEIEEGHYSGKSAISLPSTSSADPTRPSVVDQHHAIDLGGNPSNECPFSGIPVESNSTGTYPRTRIGSFKLNMNRHAMVGMFHRGIQCDGCGAHPITGPRFKSKVKEDYDLCSICFTAMGNETDYIRIDRPVHYRHPRAFKGLYDHRQNYGFGTPPAPHILRGFGINQGRSKLDSCFILDVNVLDGTIMAPYTPFTKIWRMRNSGTHVWPQGTQLVLIGGDRLTDAVSVEIEVPSDGLPVDGEVNIAVNFTSPELPGRYISYWRVASPSGVKFGQRVWVLIQVDGSMKDGKCVSFQGLNLNLPPESNRLRNPEMIDMNVQPNVDESFQEPCHSYTDTEPIKPVVDEQPKKEEELNFPINDSLLVGHGVSTSAPPPPQAPLTVSYPIIDLTDADPAEPSHAAVPFTSVPTSSEGITDKDAVERSLLKELEEMGFKQVDLNKEILRMNEYDLEQSVDDLCGVAEWDPILEELQEMGFCDEERNKRLLKKNNGSIKRVVMDLLTGERA